MRKSFAVLPVIEILLALYVALAAARVVRNTATVDGGKDFYPYWYAGRVLNVGLDPYAEFLAGRSPFPRASHLPSAPAVTAPLLALALPFSFMPWAVAKWAWLAVSMTAVGFSPLLAILVAERGGFTVAAAMRRMIVLAFFALLATRVAVGNGQLVCVVLLLLLLTLLRKTDAPWLAGVLLGFALAKYSVALAVVVFLCAQRAWRVLVAATAVQLAAAAVLSWRTGTSFSEVFRNYAAIARMHADAPGLQFPSPMINAAIAAALLAFAIWIWPRRQPELLALLCAGSLLVVYHRVYDGVLLLPWLVVSIGAKRLLAVPVLLVLILPGAIVDGLQRYAVVAATLVLAYEMARVRPLPE